MRSNYELPGSLAETRQSEGDARDSKSKDFELSQLSRKLRTWSRAPDKAKLCVLSFRDNYYQVVHSCVATMNSLVLWQRRSRAKAMPEIQSPRTLSYHNYLESLEPGAELQTKLSFVF